MRTASTPRGNASKRKLFLRSHYGRSSFPLIQVAVNIWSLKEVLITRSRGNWCLALEGERAVKRYHIHRVYVQCQKRNVKMCDVVLIVTELIPDMRRLRVRRSALLVQEVSMSDVMGISPLVPSDR